MKILVAYYSRTGTTKKVAEALAEKLGAQTEEIKDTVDRSGAIGYLLSGKDASLRKMTTLEKTSANLADFDLVIIGTPIWAWDVSVPIRTYVTENAGKFGRVAFFCTMGRSGNEKAFSEMARITGKDPVATLILTTKEVVLNQHEEKVEKFSHDLLQQ